MLRSAGERPGRRASVFFRHGGCSIRRSIVGHDQFVALADRLSGGVQGQQGRPQKNFFVVGRHDKRNHLRSPSSLFTGGRRRPNARPTNGSPLEAERLTPAYESPQGIVPRASLEQPIPMGRLRPTASGRQDAGPRVTSLRIAVARNRGDRQESSHRDRSPRRIRNIKSPPRAAKAPLDGIRTFRLLWRSTSPANGEFPRASRPFPAGS